MDKVFKQSKPIQIQIRANYLRRSTSEIVLDRTTIRSGYLSIAMHVMHSAQSVTNGTYVYSLRMREYGPQDYPGKRIFFWRMFIMEQRDKLTQVVVNVGNLGML